MLLDTPPKYSGSLTYQTSSDIKELNNFSGDFEVNNDRHGSQNSDDYIVGNNWYTDKKDKSFFEEKWQGPGTIRKWRNEILEDWAERWKCLKKEWM